MNKTPAEIMSEQMGALFKLGYEAARANHDCKLSAEHGCDCQLIEVGA